MNWDAIGAIGEIVGATAVVVTLIYLTTQIRQNTRQLASTSLQGLADRAENRLLLLASNPEFAKAGFKFFNEPESMSEVEAAQMGFWIAAWMTDLEETYRQFKLGTVSAPTMDARVRNFRSLCETQVGRMTWDQSHGNCEPDFVEWLEHQLLD